MQKWEYLYAYFSSHNLDFVEIDGISGKDSTQQDIALRKKLGLGTGDITRAYFLKWCGQNGWEISGFTSGFDISRRESMIFKKLL